MFKAEKIIPTFLVLSVISAIVMVVILGNSIIHRGTAKTTLHPKIFSQEKVLTATAEEYCKAMKKNLSEFDLVGIHGGNLGNLIARRPKNTEVIVSYGSADDNYYGTALVPKRKS
jgi:hypothetical protein